jgi:hypothetical protein
MVSRHHHFLISRALFATRFADLRRTKVRYPPQTTDLSLSLLPTFSPALYQFNKYHFLLLSKKKQSKAGCRKWRMNRMFGIQRRQGLLKRQTSHVSPHTDSQALPHCHS